MDLGIRSFRFGARPILRCENASFRDGESNACNTYPPGNDHISPKNMAFWVDDFPNFPRWDMLIPWRVYQFNPTASTPSHLIHLSLFGTSWLRTLRHAVPRRRVSLACLVIGQVCETRTNRRWRWHSNCNLDYVSWWFKVTFLGWLSDLFGMVKWPL